MMSFITSVGLALVKDEKTPTISLIELSALHKKLDDV